MRQGVKKVNTDDIKERYPSWCEGCPSGAMEYLNIVRNDKGEMLCWHAAPCGQVKRRGVLEPKRVNYCFNHYEGVNNGTM